MSTGQEGLVAGPGVRTHGDLGVCGGVDPGLQAVQSMYLCIKNKHTHIHIYIYIYTYTYLYVYTQVVHIHIHICLHIHICIGVLFAHTSGPKVGVVSILAASGAGILQSWAGAVLIPVPSRALGPGYRSLRILVPRAIQGMVFGASVLKHWVLGPSGPQTSKATVG